MSDYTAFLESKVQFRHSYGFTIPRSDLSPTLKPHQADFVLWALEKGRALIAAAFGLGKTVVALEVCRHIQRREGGRQLIICPLGVRQEFLRDAALVGLAGQIRFVRRSQEVDAPGIYLTNYESVRDGKLDPALFNTVWLDEASVLRSYGSKTYQTFLTLFDGTQYRFAATATPAPNRYKELIHYAGFLGVMDTGQALTRFFQRDSTKANNLTLYPHMVQEFFAWLHSWAIFVQRPSDLGHSDEGYDLPELVVHYHEIPSAVPIGKFERDGQATMISDAALGLKDAADEKRDSIAARVAKMREILEEDPDSHYLLWHHREAERHEIKRVLPEAVSVWGTQDLEEREQAIIDFSDGRFKYLSTKPEIAGSGCNFQRFCHKAIFVGIDYSFNDFIQAIHRVHRFLQRFPVEIHVIYTEAEREVLRVLQAKWREDEQLRAQMAELIRTYGLGSTGLERELTRTIGCERKVYSGTRYEVVNADCVEETQRMATNAVDGMILTSVPFGNHYEYSASINDFGHNPDHESFFRQMDYLTPELLRVLAPGRVLAVHVKDRIRFGNVTGYGFPTVEPFHADCIHHYRRHGFRYFGMITVSTDVVRENNQNYRLGYSEMLKDGTKMGVGSPEYVLLFRKQQTDATKGYADVPVAREPEDYSLARWQVDAHALWRSSGNRLLTAEELAQYGPDVLAKLFHDQSRHQVYSYEDHVAIGEALADRGALPTSFMSLAPASHRADIWTDVVRMHTLNGEQERAGLEHHICPLQFDIVDRLIERYTNPGETVYDPFGGLFTVPLRAVKLGRFGRAAELKPEYVRDGLRYLRAAEEELDAPSLFDMLEPEGAV